MGKNNNSQDGEKFKSKIGGQALIEGPAKKISSLFPSSVCRIL